MRPAPLPAILRAAPWAAVAVLAFGGLWGGPTAMQPWLHVAVAVATATCAAAASRAIVARRSGSARDAAFATGAAMLAGAILVHAAATPGAAFDANRLVGVSGLTAIMFLAGGALAALLLPARMPLRRASRVAAVAGALVALALAGSALVPGLLDLAPPAVPVAMLVMLVPAAATLVLTGIRAVHQFGARRDGSVALEAGCALLGASLLMHFGPAWTGAFWLSHGFELGGASLLAFGCSRAFAPARGAFQVVDALPATAVPPAAQRPDVGFDAAA